MKEFVRLGKLYTNIIYLDTESVVNEAARYPLRVNSTLALLYCFRISNSVLR